MGNDKWDISYHFDGDPIYDTNKYSIVEDMKSFPLRQPYFMRACWENSCHLFWPCISDGDKDFGKHEEEMIKPSLRPFYVDI